MTETTPTLELLPRDLAPYRTGNTGIPYVHRFDSGRPGPHVLVNALTHGNEFCGMVAATHLLDREVRPLRGVLTVSFANVEAYESFSQDDPFASRQLVHNMNRIWSPDWLEGGGISPELRRARELRPVLAAADHILDMHSTSQPVEPFWVYPAFDRNERAATAIGVPAIHLVMPDGLGTGTPVIQHGRHGDPHSDSVALVAECGQHFLQATGELAVEVTLRFIAHFGLIDAAPDWAPPAATRRYELLSTEVVQHGHVQFSRPVVGLETFARGELIATDGEREIRSPCDGCTIFMPTRKAVIGRELVYLTRPLS
ncbi:succinylglutamate desuccinylase/aspartoacylase domain-containing protein [Ramlibacter sp. Leaf400]|uniref:succinylglutamate desuccinylase/aspartoacylase domain-containing protein n=1 Tax=Ramlibacter sp. Leaf400 TaxID=1736365 RepID=UPI0006F3D62F|nr:succinylglutamate desuccinylase/aspartoacylase family protein [Ramlibacter sp. Leaf400]KQT09543.1 succinylglutamate desuccinylase [Ramlibacter sp. Leaf400]